MTPLAHAAFEAPEIVANPLLTPEQTPKSDANQSLDLFTDGIHEAVFTIVNGNGIKEQVEEVVMTRGNHLRNGEGIALVEREKETVIHQQFNTVVSVQAIIADLKHRNIAADVKISWGN
jgi:hypothetical protein